MMESFRKENAIPAGVDALSSAAAYLGAICTGATSRFELPSGPDPTRKIWRERERWDRIGGFRKLYQKISMFLACLVFFFM